MLWLAPGILKRNCSQLGSNTPGTLG